MSHVKNVAIRHLSEGCVIPNIEIDELKKSLLDKERQLESYRQELASQKSQYDNLYNYSCNRDFDLTVIKNSIEYKIGRIVFIPFRISVRLILKIFRIMKAIICINKEKLKLEFMFIKKIWKLIEAKFTKRRFFKVLSEAVIGKTIVIFPPTLDWHMPLYQRPHQLAKSYSKRKNTCAIFLTPNFKYDDIYLGELITDNLFIINAQLFDSISHIINKADTVIMSISWTVNKFYMEKVKVDYLIYEYIDELEIFYLYGPEMEEDHKKMIKIADVTVSTATKLYNQVKDSAKNPICSTNGGDYDFFTKTKNMGMNQSVVYISAGYKCVLGYYGALAEWFDYDMVIKIANKKPDWLWVLIGLDYDGSLQKSGILSIKNIVYLGTKPYEELPSYLASFDIATIPFKINEITLSTSPVKLFEYMAGGKPILTSRMPECMKYKSAHIYNNADEFILLAEKILQMEQEDPYWDLLEKEALDNTWDAKVDEILNALPIKDTKRISIIN